jgi:enoyl-CoA hydratase/carnithine racemase
VIARDDRDSVAVLRMAHGKVSALDAAFCDALVAELDAVKTGPSKALILIGTGSAFSAGVDLFQVLNGGAEYIHAFLPRLEKLLRALLAFPKPLVAAVNGHAIAGGCIMVATCDYRVMSTGTGRIGVPELAVGVPFPSLPFEIMSARVNPSALRQLIYGGKVVPAAEALTLGLVDEVAEPDALLDRAFAAAAPLAAIPTHTFALTRRAFEAQILSRVAAAEVVNDAVEDAWSSPEVHAAIRAYLDKTIGRKA